MVEAWYKAMERIRKEPLVLQDLQQIECFVTEDVFFVGFNPAKVTRRLDLVLDMKELYKSPDYMYDEDWFMA